MYPETLYAHFVSLELIGDDRPAARPGVIFPLDLSTYSVGREKHANYRFVEPQKYAPEIFSTGTWQDTPLV